MQEPWEGYDMINSKLAATPPPPLFHSPDPASAVHHLQLSCISTEGVMAGGLRTHLQQLQEGAHDTTRHI